MNMFYNFLIFFAVFKFGTIDLAISFNQIDLIVAVLPLLFSLGIERVFIFSSSDRHLDKAFIFLYSLITISMGGALFVSFFIGFEIIVAVVFAYIYAFSNICVAYSQVSNTKDGHFFVVNFIKLVALSVALLLFNKEVFIFDLDALFVMLIITASFIFLINVKNLNFSSELFKFIVEYFSRSKYILLMTAIGAIYSNLPRVYELIIGSEYLSVKFFFWLKLMSYIGALGLVFNYWITKYVIIDKGFKNLYYSGHFGVLIISTGLTGINLLNLLTPIDFLEDQKIDQIYLILFSVTILSSFLRDAYIENILSLQGRFDKRYHAFLIAALTTLLTMLVCYYIGILSSLTMTVIFTVGTLLWMIVAIFYAKKEELEFKFIILWIYLAFFILINFLLMSII